MKKTIALLLALCFVFGLMAGCGSAGTSVASSAAATSASEPSAAETSSAASEEASEAPSEAEEASASEDAASGSESTEASSAAAEGELTEYAVEIFGTDVIPEEISYPLDTDETLELMATFPNPLFASFPNGMADCDIYIEAETATGVKMTYTPLSTEASNEQFNVIMASGDYPDLVGWGLNYATGDNAAVEDDVYYDLTDYISEYAPNYLKVLGTDDELLDLALTDSGYITGFHAVVPEATLGKAGLVIRTDLLEKNGLEKPYTIEEYENVLATFKDEGLDQPLVMLAPGAMQDNWLAAAFDVAAFCNSFPMSVLPTYVQDGEVKFGPLEDSFKDYIELVKDWYDKGYIASDFITLNSNWNGPEYSNAITTGEAGIFYSDQGNIGGYIQTSDIDGFALEATYDMHATADSVNHFAGFSGKSVGNGFHITTCCENIELACQWGDWWYTEEGSMLANYGIEGRAYELVDGKPVFTELVTDPQEVSARDALLVYASNNTICCIIDPEAATSGYSEVDKAAPEIWAEGMDDSYVIPSTVSLTVDEQTDANAIVNDILTLCMESIAKFINGDKPMDEFDAFVESIRSMNIDGYLEIYQGAYDRAMES